MNDMIERYRDEISKLLPEVEDELFLHDIYVQILVHVEGDEKGGRDFCIED